MPPPKFRIPRPPLTPDQATVQKNSETMERELIFGMARSCNFYRQARQLVCPYDAERKTYRQDFTIPRYNVLFRAIDSWYRRFDKTTLEPDMTLPAHLLAGYIVDWGNKSEIDLEVCQRLETEILEEVLLAEEITFVSSMALLESDGFKYWLDQRLTTHFLKRAEADHLLGITSLDTLEAHMKKMRQSRGKMAQEHMLTRQVLESRIVFNAALKSGIAELDLALGGGFRLGEGSLIAAINGGGKTILAMQLALTFAINDHKVVVITTERKPPELVMRTLANYTNTILTRLIERPDLDLALSGEQADFAAVPEWMWTDPGMEKKMKNYRDSLANRILYIDWSQGQAYSVEAQLDASLEFAEAAGFNPKAVIFDWIGGGLEEVKDKSHLRHAYQSAIDYLTNHAKKRNRAVIATAQLDKNKIGPNTQYIEMNMLSECKGMTNNISNFIGVTALRGSANSKKINTEQFLTVSKSTLGPGGNVPVNQVFSLQRFEPRKGIASKQ